MVLTGCHGWPNDFAVRYKESGCWRGETFGEMLKERAMKQGNLIAVTSGEKHLSYEDLDRRVDRLAAG
ncbi:2,3-dihydroxybenzoate-AMP ligase, partial [Bacillus pseudomycoides]